METHKTFSIRIPNELFGRLEDAVARDGRSRNAIIVDALGRHLEFLRVVAESSAELIASLSANRLKEVAIDQLVHGASQAQAAGKAEPPASSETQTPEASGPAFEQVGNIKIPRTTGDKS
jgi:predicted DNA-binding protein